MNHLELEVRRDHVSNVMRLLSDPLLTQDPCSHNEKQDRLGIIRVYSHPSVGIGVIANGSNCKGQGYGAFSALRSRS